MSYRPFWKDHRQKIFTSCNDCQFLKNQQCEVGRHDILRSQGREIQIDESGSPAVELACMAFRPPEWEGTIDDMFKELEIKVSLLLIVTPICTADELKTSMDSVLKMDLRPAKVDFVMLDNSQKAIFNAMDIIQSHELFNNEMLWSVRKLRDITTLEASLNEAVNLTEYGYYCVFYAGTEIPSNYLRERDNYINRKLDPQLFVYTEDFPEFTFVHKDLHYAVGGWKLHYEHGEVLNIKDKIATLSLREEECQQ